MALQFPRFGEFHMLDLEVRDKPKMSPDCFAATLASAISPRHQWRMALSGRHAAFLCQRATAPRARD
jgi:hypothetical protein